MDTAYLLPYVKSEGEEVFFSCNTLMPSDDIHWERDDGAPLPPDSSVSYGVLHIPNVTLSDEGTYKCIAKQGEFETETEFRLQVDDFVPVFFGSESIEFKPLEDEQIDNLNIQLSVKPAALDGVLFATERRGEVNPDRYVVTVEGDRRPPVNQHLARLQNGVVIYEYDIGHGRDELVLPMPIPLNEWSTVEVRNEPKQASVTLNGGISVKKDHPTPVPFPGTNKPLTIGRQSEEDQIRRPLPGLKGVVSEVIVSGENLPLARGEPTPGVRPYDACKAQPCANGGRCRKANRARGYTCACEPPFGGYQCETLSSKCKDADCNTGICLEEGDSYRCICPVNTSGPHCQRPAHRTLKKSFAFMNKTSFLAVQSPLSLEQMKISLRLRPQQLQGDRILMYTASQHGSAPPAHMSLSLNEGKLVYAQHNGLERQELKSVEIGQRELTTGIDVLVTRDKYSVSLVVNGRNSSAKNTVASFSPNTDFYIGGFPPAFKAADGIPTEAFMGCIEDVVINSKEIDLSTQSPPSSGDLIPCEDILFESEIETTASLTVEDLVTEVTVEETEDPWTEPPVASVTALPTDEAMTTTTTEEPIVIGYTPKDEALQEIPWVQRPTTTEATITTTMSTTTTSTTTTTTEEPTTKTTEEPTTTTTSTTTTTTATEPEPVFEEPVVPTEGLTTEPPTITEATENFYKTPKDGVEPSENLSGSQEVETDPAREENVTQCADGSCFVTTQKPDVCANNDCGANGRCEPYNGSHYECICNLFYDGPRCGIFKPIEHAAHFNGDAFIEISADELPHLSSEKEESLSLRFKTTTQNGLLMWQGQQSGVPIAGEDYFSLAITNGYLHYSYELGGGAAHLVSPTRIADGKEHVVKLSRRGRRGSMYLDDLEEIKGVSSGILAMLNVDGNIFIGGIPSIETNTGGLHEHNFIGCIADVRMNGEKLDLMGTAVDGKNVRPCEEWIEPKRHLRFLKKRKRLQ